MMLLAVLGRSKTSPGQLAWGVILIMAITGAGCCRCSSCRTGWLISQSSPVKWGYLRSRRVSGERRHRRLALSLGVLLTVGCGGFVAGAKAFVLSERLAND